MTQQVKSNARRFIASYNAIDAALRAQQNLKRSLTFSDVIRKSVICNSIVRRHEEDLIDYSRLRNAIIHGSDEEHPIAEPNDDIVEKIEKLEKLITTPPKVLETICRKDVLTIDYNTSLKDTIIEIFKSGYSNIPVYCGEELVGIANGQKIINVLGDVLLRGINVDEFLTNTPIVEILKITRFDNYFELVSKDLTIEKVLDMFNANRKLLVILITERGTNTEPPLGVVTASDIVDINNIMDNYV